MEQIKSVLINIIEWIKNECKDWKTFIIFVCVIMVVYSPVWVGYILFFVFKWKWCLAMATAILVFWAGPFTPFFPLCIIITLGIKKLIEERIKIS